MSGVAAEVVALLLLAAVLAFAMIQPRGLSEATVAVTAAAITVALGIVGPAEALVQMRGLAAIVAFLAAILLLAHLADAEGVFRWLGDRLASFSRGRPRRLLAVVFIAAAITTAVLSLDATVVLLRPVVFGTAARLRLWAKPHVYACTHLANSASTVLPVSNLTNLLAFGASGLSFLGFTALMAAPWLTSLTVEFLAFRWFFATDLAGSGESAVAPAVRAAPRFALAVLALTLAGSAASLLHRNPPGRGGGRRRRCTRRQGLGPRAGRPVAAGAGDFPALLPISCSHSAWWSPESPPTGWGPRSTR